MANDTRSTTELFRRQEELAREGEPHKPTVLDEETVRAIVREEIERLVGLVVKGLTTSD